MFRILAIALISFIAVVPFLVLFNRILDVGNDLAGYLSFFFAWLITPILLSKCWKILPDIMVIPVAPDDPIMLMAIKKSRENFQRFIEGLTSQNYEAYIKFPYKFEHTTEHIWGLAHQVRDETVMVSLESIPVEEMTEEMYERMPVAFNKIEDWMLVDSKGKTQGGYSALAHAKIYKRDNGKIPKKHIKDLENFTDFTWKG